MQLRVDRIEVARERVGGGRNKVLEIAEVEVAGMLLRRCRPRILAAQLPLCLP